MSATDKAIGLVKNVLLFREMLERVQSQLNELRSDIANLAQGHAVLSDRVARIEGFIEGAAAASSPARGKLPRK